MLQASQPLGSTGHGLGSPRLVHFGAWVVTRQVGLYAELKCDLTVRPRLVAETTWKEAVSRSERVTQVLVFAK